jgi:hypothetical protein
MPCVGDWLPGFVLMSFQSTSTFFTYGFLPCFLVGFVPSFMRKRIGLHKLFAKLCYYRTLFSFLSGRVVNCSQRSYIMLLS